MANNNPFANDQESKKKEQNWFMKTAIQAAAFAGTGFGIYGIWKVSGPARRALEKAVDDRMRRVIDEEQYRSSDHFKEETASFFETRKEALKYIKESFKADPDTAWNVVDTSQGTRNNITRIESDILSRLSREAALLNPETQIIRRKPGEKYSANEYEKLNRKGNKLYKKVSLSGKEAQEFGLARFRAIRKYLRLYGEAITQKLDDPSAISDLANMSDFFYGNEYLKQGDIDADFGKRSLERVTTIHDAYLKDKKYADLYLSEIKKLHTTMQSRNYAIVYNKIENFRMAYPGGYRQILYGNIADNTDFHPSLFKVNPLEDKTVSFDSENPEITVRKGLLLSKGKMQFASDSVWLRLQETDYTGQIRDLAETLKSAKDEGYLSSYKVSLLDYGTSISPDKRLRVTLVGVKADPTGYYFELPISIDGRLPGSTPGLTQQAERYHLIGEGFGHIRTERMVNTSQRIMEEVTRNLKGSLLKGAGNTFGENPRDFLRRIKQIISGIRQENAAADGSIAGMIHAMSVDDPVFKDLVFSERAKHAHVMSAAKNFVITARNTRKFIDNTRRGKNTILINLDLETLDNTSGSPEKTLLTKAAQIVKAGIVVQEGNKVIDSYELSNGIGYKYFQDIEKYRPGDGFNKNLENWLRRGVLPEHLATEENIASAYKAYIDQLKTLPGWSNARDNTEFIKEVSDKILSIIAKAERDNKEVLIVTKNGLNFDLKAFLMYNPQVYKILKEKSIDIQSMHWYRNAGLGESNALKLESVMRALMGRLGAKEHDYLTSKGELNPVNIIKILKQKALSVQDQNTILLDWTEDAFKEFHQHPMLLRPHAAPKVDAVFTAALRGELITDFMAGEADYINAAETLNELITEVEQGPLSPDTLMKFFRKMNNRPLRGFSFDIGSQNLISQLTANFLDLNDLNVIASPNSSTGRRLTMSPFNITLSKGFVTKSGGNRTSLSRKYLGRFTVSQSVADAATNLINNLPIAEDQVNHFSNTVRANVLYRFDWAGTDRGISVTKEYMNMFSRKLEISVPTHGEGAIVNNKLQEFVKLSHKKAEEIAQAAGEPVNRQHLVEAIEYVKKNPPKHLRDWRIKLSEEILSASKFGGEIAIPKRAIYGEIKGILIEPDTIGSERVSAGRTLVKMEYILSGEEAMAQAQKQLLGAHGVVTVARGLTEGLGSFGKHKFSHIAGAEFLKKADIGAFKNIMLNTVLTHLNDQIEDKDTQISVKNKAEALRNKILETLKAESDLKNNRFIFKGNSLSGSPIDEQVRLYGNTEVRISQLIKWYREAGLVWNQEEIKNLREHNDVFKKYEEEFIKQKAVIVAQMKSKFEAMNMTEKQLKGQLASVEDDLEAIISMFRIEHAGEAGIKAFQLVNYGPGKALGLVSLNDVGALYNFDPTTSRGGVSMFRQDYLFGVAWSLQGQNKSTMEFLTKYTYAKLDKTYQSALATKLQFNNTMFTEAWTKNKSLNITQINSLVDIQKRVEERREKVKLSQKKWGLFSYQSLSAAYRDTQELLARTDFIGNEAAQKQLKDEAAEIVDMLSKTVKTPFIFERIGKMSNVYSHEDIKKIEKLAFEGKGVLQFELPRIAGSDVLTVDLKELMNTAFSQGYKGFTSTEMEKYKDKLVHLLKAHKNNTIKGAPIRLLDDGRLELGAAIFDWDPTRGNNFNFSDGLDLATRETQIKIQAMEALYKYQDYINKATSANENIKDLKPIEGFQDEFIRKYMAHLLIGLSGNKDSNFWKSGQFALNSNRLIHKDINSVWSNILQIESTTKFDKKYRETIDQIKNARIDTVLIHENAFKDFKYFNMTQEEVEIKGESGNTRKVTRWSSQDLVERVSAAKVIADNLRAEGMNDAQIREYFTGRKSLPGGLFARFPITQSGYDGVRTGRYLVIPKEVSKIIGVDANSVYANPVYLAAQKADFDGDQIFCHLKELATLKAFKEISEEDDRTFKQILELPEVASELKKTQITFNSDGTLTGKVKIGTFNSIISHQGDKTLISYTNPTSGKNEFKTVGIGALDFSDMVKHVTGWVEESAKRGGRATSTQLLAASEAKANTLLSKNIIPLTTNLLKQRMFELIGSDVGKVKNPAALMTFFGNIKHGIAGMAQAVIEMDKHSEKAAGLVATLDWLKNPSREAPKAKQYYMQMRQEQLGKSFDWQLEEESWNFFSGKLKDISIMRRNSPDFKMNEDRVLDFLMGKRGATSMDLFGIGDMGTLINEVFNDAPDFSRRTLMGDINDALSTKLGKQIDIAPIFRKTGKYGAIGAAVFMGLGMFTPFGNSKSLNPIDMFVDLGEIDGRPSALASPLELGRGSPLDMVDASFSKEAFIRVNKGNRNEKKQTASIINRMLMGSELIRSEGYYEFQSKPYKSYANYTTRVPTFGSKELKRRSEL